MVDAPLLIIYKMAILFLSSTIDTAFQMFGLFRDLINSLAYTIAVAGPLGYILSFAILAPVIYLMSKFYGDTAKTTILGVILVIIVLVIITAFAA